MIKDTRKIRRIHNGHQKTGLKPSHAREEVSVKGEYSSGSKTGIDEEMKNRNRERMRRMRATKEAESLSLKQRQMKELRISNGTQESPHVVSMEIDSDEDKPIKVEPIKVEPIEVEPIEVEPIEVEPIEVEPTNVACVEDKSGTGNDTQTNAFSTQCPVEHEILTWAQNNGQEVEPTKQMVQCFWRILAHPNKGGVSVSITDLKSVMQLFNIDLKGKAVRTKLNHAGAFVAFVFVQTCNCDIGSLLKMLTDKQVNLSNSDEKKKHTLQKIVKLVLENREELFSHLPTGALQRYEKFEAARTGIIEYLKENDPTNSWDGKMQEAELSNKFPHLTKMIGDMRKKGYFKPPQTAEDDAKGAADTKDAPGEDDTGAGAADTKVAPAEDGSPVSYKYLMQQMKRFWYLPDRPKDATSIAWYEVQLKQHPLLKNVLHEDFVKAYNTVRSEDVRQSIGRIVNTTTSTIPAKLKALKEMKKPFQQGNEVHVKKVSHRKLLLDLFKDLTEQIDVEITSLTSVQEEPKVDDPFDAPVGFQFGVSPSPAPTEVGLFGSTAEDKPASVGGLFGTTPASTPPAPAPAPAPTEVGLFGSTAEDKPASVGGLFGTTPASTPPAPAPAPAPAAEDKPAAPQNGLNSFSFDC